MTSEIENARIEEVYLGNGDRSHGQFTVLVTLDFGGTSQGFYLRPGSLPDLFKVVGVSEFKDLVGKFVRADHGWSCVYRVGNILRDEWLELEGEKA